MNDSNPHDAESMNDGFKSRSAFSTRGTFDMVGIIHSDLFFQSKFLLNDISIKVRLVRNKESFGLTGAVDATFNIRIVDCKLHVRKVRLSPSVFVAHAKALEKGNVKYPIKRTVCKTFTIPAGNLDARQESLFSGQMPTRIVIRCVQNRGFNGSYNLNPFNFEHFNLTQVKIYLDGQQHSMKPLETDFANHLYVTAFTSLFAGTGKLYQDEGNRLTMEDFEGGYALYLFDVTQDLADGGHFNLLKKGSVRLDLKFGAALESTINVIAYAEFENCLEVDRSIHIIFDYKN